MQAKSLSVKHTLSALALATSAFLLAACGQAPEQDAGEAKETATTQAAQSIANEPAPRYFEEVEGEQALAQVNEWNNKSLSKLMADERFTEFQQEALDILNATDKIAFGSIAGDYIYNFWQDDTHVKGILRRTSLDSYMNGYHVDIM